MTDYTCEVCMTINRVGDIPPGSTGFRCGGCGNLISVATGANVQARSAKPEHKDAARVLAQRYWTSDVSTIARKHGGVCDRCNTPLSQGDGYLTGPLTAEDTTPSLFCGSCFDSQAREPWDREVSRMSVSDALLWRVVAENQLSLGRQPEAAPPMQSPAVASQESEMHPKILMQQHDKSFVSAAVGMVPVITTTGQYVLMEFEVVFAINFLRAGCPGVQFGGIKSDVVPNAVMKAQSEFDRFALRGETFRVTARREVLVVTRRS